MNAVLVNSILLITAVVLFFALGFILGVAKGYRDGRKRTVKNISNYIEELGKEEEEKREELALLVKMSLRERLK